MLPPQEISVSHLFDHTMSSKATCACTELALAGNHVCLGIILVEQARLQPSASVLWWLCYFTGRGTRKSAPCSPFEGSCHASSVYSARHCVVLDRSLSLKSPHTHSLFHECLSYLFKDTLLKSFFPLPRVI